MDKRLFKSILLIITYTVVLVLALARLDVVAGAIAYVLDLFRPYIGFALAFVLNRPCHFFYRLYSRGLGKTRAAGAARPLAVLSSYLALIVVATAVISFVVPKLAESIQTFILNLSGYITNIQDWVNQLAAYLHLDMKALDLSSLNQTLENLFKQAQGFLSDLGPRLLEFTTGIVSLVVTGVLALVFSIYMLSGKEKLLGQCRRMLRAYVPKKFADPITDVARLTGDTFTRFVTGQLIEACILGGAVHGGDAVHPGGLRPPHRGHRRGLGHHPGGGGLYRGHRLGGAAADGLPPEGPDLPGLPGDPPADRGQRDLPQGGGHLHRLPGIWVLAAVTVGGSLLGLEGCCSAYPPPRCCTPC